MGESLDVLQAFLEFLKYLYLGNLFTFIALIGCLSCAFVRIMNYPYRLQFQAMPFPHPLSLTNQTINPLNYIISYRNHSLR